MSGFQTLKNNNSSIIIGVVIFLIIFVFFIVVFVASAISEPVTTTSDFITGDFLSDCTTLSCNENLVCDGTNYTCRLPEGSPCLNYSDCLSGLVCSGLCATGGIGLLNQLCPCISGMRCVTLPSGLNICKGLSGTQCKTGSDCVSGLCSSGLCESGAPNSYPCTNNSQCNSNYCSLGFCQNLNVKSGTIGSACSTPCVSFGNDIQGSSCDQSSNLICQCSNPNSPGICSTPTQGILSSCSPSLSCGLGLVCYDPSAKICTTDSSNCVCNFPYNNPNSQTPQQTCIVGMTPNSSGSCLNNINLGCDKSSMCSTSLCSGGSVVASYKFNNNTDIQFPGTTSTSIVPIFSGPSGIIQPYKLFTNYSGSIDTIFLVDSLQGLLSINYDTSTQSTGSGWILNIPHSSTISTNNYTIHRVLIDASYNGQNFIVAFDETLSSDSQSIQNDTLYIGPSLASLSPFNFQPGSGLTGTQYTSDGTPLSINYVDISTNGDVLISINGTIYVKRFSDYNYSISNIIGGPMNNTPMSGLTGPSRFYFDTSQNSSATGPTVCPSQGPNNPVLCPSYQNISFVGPFTDQSITLNQVLQFSGNVAGVAIPVDIFRSLQYQVFDYDIYSSPSQGMNLSSIIALANSYNNGAFVSTIVSATFSGTTAILPYRVSPTSRVATTPNALYILSIASCSTN